MPIVPVRDLGKYGVITDVDPFNLPIGAWSMAVNARFYNGQVSRGPVFRAGVDFTSTNLPRFIKVFDPGTGTDINFLGMKNGTVVSATTAGGWAFATATPGTFTPADSEASWTACDLGGVCYVNRPDHVPWAFLPGATPFVDLANWDAGWRTNILRAFNGALVALNVTKSGTNYPTLVKTSDILADVGIVPSSWDHTLTTNNATENPLVGMKSAITDASVLGGELIIYGLNEAWVMQATGSTDVYAYRKLPFNKGAINVNCSVEIGNKHYVFGANDIWVHDGTSEQSIADGRVRNFIYNGLKPSGFSRCFVAHNYALREVSFCYVSGDAYVKYEGNGCNRAAVYNYVNDTWAFDDLPLVFSADMTNSINQTGGWDTSAGSSTWDSFGGSWQDQGAGFKRAMAYMGELDNPGSNGLLYVQDLWGTGSISTYDVVPLASPTLVLERNWMDLDELGEELRGYKHVLALYPEARLDPASAALEFRFGSADYATPESLPLFSGWQTYDNNGNYKLDYTDGGRYLSLQCRYQDYKSMVLTGLDVDLVSTGSR